MHLSKRMALAVLFFVFSPVSFSFAQEYRGEGIKIGQQELRDAKGIAIFQGKTRIKAYLADENRLDSNVFLSNTDRKTDYMNIMYGKVLLDMPFGIDERHLLQLMYTGEGGVFANWNSQNYYNQDGTANLNLILPYGYLNVQELFRSTSDRAGTEFTTRVERNENTAAVTYGAEFNKLAVELGYSDFLRLYRGNSYDNLNYMENKWTGIGYYQLFPKTKALLEYNFGLLDYFDDSSRDGNYNQVRGGLKGDLTGKTVGIVKLGFQYRQYDKKDNQDFSGFVAEVGTDTKFTERTELILKYIQSPQESTYSPNNYYNEHTFIAQVNQKLINHLSITAQMQYDLNRYPDITPGTDKKRIDNILTPNISLEYAVKEWAKIKLGYEFKNDQSNIGEQCYRRNLAYASCSIAI